MKYNKSVIFLLAILAVFSGSCLVATYKINQDMKIMSKPFANQELKEGLKSRLENV